MSARSPVPSYRLHKQSGQAIVTLPDGLGGRRDILLGKHGSAESRAAYRRILVEWEANGRRLPQPAATTDLSVNEVALAYWRWAVAYYRWGKRDGHCLKDALRVLKGLYGHTQAREFGPRALKACRQRMVEMDWSRTYTNAQANRLRRMFRWAAEEELLPGSIYQDLKTVAGLQAGRTGARETAKIKPVSAGHVAATLPHLPEIVRAMVQFQQLTGARPTEICSVRPVDLDMHNPACWVFRPGSDQGPHGAHKTAHHGYDRLILIGPRAQEVLRPYLGTRLDAFCFSPRQSEEVRHVRQREGRRTPLTPSQRARKPKANRKRGLRERYDVTSYRNAVYRGCDRAFPAPTPLGQGEGETRKEWQARLTPEQREDLRRWRREHHWHPNRLRHSRATELRPYGLDLTKTILGHNKVETTQVYAEKDLAAAMELVAKIG